MKPVLQALVLAERVYQDVSGKKIIAGTFNQIITGQVQPPQLRQPDGTLRPGILGGTDPGCPSVYISLTDVKDRTTIDLQFVNVAKNTIIFRSSILINCTDPLATIEIIAPLPAMTELSKELGDFSLDILWNGEILGSHRLLVRPLPG